MPHKITIGDYKKMMRFLISSGLINITLIAIQSLLFVFDYVSLDSIWGKFLFFIPLSLPMFLLFMLKQYYSKEEVRFEPKRLMTQRFGVILPNEIERIKENTSFGYINIVVNMKNGNRIVFSPAV